MSEKNSSSIEGRRKFAGLFIPAGLFIGMGVGWGIDAFLPAMFIGLGAGFLCFAMVLIFAKD